MRFRKLFCTVLSVSALLFSLPTNVDALSENEISAPSAVLMDASSGEVLYEKNPHEVRACASITKVMTLTLVMEELDSGRLKWSDIVTTSEHASSMGGSDIWLEPGETMTVDEMVKATIVASANDAAVALAEHICGSEDEFVARMNEKAKQLGMKETVFKNCNGLDETGHVTSAYDVALMSRELIRHPSIFKYSKIWMDNLRGGKTQLVNTNKLLKSYKGITGLKTGTTSQAGSCITATAERDGLSLIAVVLGSASGKQRFTDAAALLDFGFANYTMFSPKSPEEAFSNIQVTNGMTDSIRTETKVDGAFLVKKGGEQEITYELSIPETVEAPIKKGDKVGEVIYKKAGKKVGVWAVTSVDDAEKINLPSVFSIMFSMLIR